MIKAERNGKGTGSVEISGSMNEFKGICNGVRKMFVDEFGEDVFMEKEKRMDASDAIGALLRHVFE